MVRVSDRFRGLGVALEDFVPRNLPQNIASLAGVASKAASKAARNVIQGEDSEEDSEQNPEENPEENPPPPPPKTMTTFSQRFKVVDIKTFDGTPANLDIFDNSIEQCLMVQNLPFYYGGYVTGDPDDEYEYVALNTRNSKANYAMGRRLCAALTTKLEGTAACWWQEYDRKE